MYERALKAYKVKVIIPLCALRGFYPVRPALYWGTAFCVGTKQNVAAQRLESYCETPSKSMLALLIHAAPLSGKCKRSKRVENGVRATLVPLQPPLPVSDASLVSVSSSQAERSSPPIVDMSCSTSVTAVSTTSTFSEDRSVISRQEKTTAEVIAAADWCSVTASGGVLEHVTSIPTSTHTHLLQLRGESAASTLEWCEARRIGSEPAVCLQTWPSSANLEWERDDDDVFTVTDAEVWSDVYPEDEVAGEPLLHDCAT